MQRIPLAEHSLVPALAHILPADSQFFGDLAPAFVELIDSGPLVLDHATLVLNHTIKNKTGENPLLPESSPVP